ncbi:MAG: hypothetical protein AB7R89_03290 [Dehalococcoidia bacterium]
MSILNMVYMNTAKIDIAYSSTVERVEEQLKSTESSRRNDKTGGKLGLGKLLSVLGLNFELTGELSEEGARSREVIQRLFPAQRFQMVQKYAADHGKLLILDEQALANDDFQSIEFDLAAVQSNFKVERYHELVDHLLFMGRKSNWTIRLIASAESLISDSMTERFLLLSRSARGVALEVIGVLVGVDSANKLLDIDPMVMYYKGKAWL